MGPGRIAVEIAKNVAAGLVPWRRPLDYYSDWKTYGEGVFAKHVDALNAFGFSIDGRDVLEIGPGPSLWAVYLCRTKGARTATAIDVRDCLVEGGGPAGALSQIRYLVPCSAENVSLPAESLDLVYSQAALEHVRVPKKVVSEQWRLLRPGAYVSHQIDTRNHLDFEHPTDHLDIPEVVWRMMTSNRSVYTNRYSIEEWIALFADQGFEILESIETASIEHPDRPDGGLLVRAQKPFSSGGLS